MHNQCLYCVVSHSALHRIYSKKPTLADQVQTHPSVPAKGTIYLKPNWAVVKSLTIHYLSKFREYIYSALDLVGSELFMLMQTTILKRAQDNSLNVWIMIT